MTYPRGSVWRKWDLHIHSPLSLMNNQFPKRNDGSPDWDAYISRLEELQVSVIGITDYFTIDGYRRIREFRAAGKLGNIDLILPNIEFRLDRIVSSRKDGQETRLNFHVIFSDEVAPEDIEEHFLHDINFYYQGDPQNPDEKRKLKVSNLAQLGETLLRQHEKFRRMNISPAELGATQAVVGDEEITEILSGDSRFKDKYLTILAADGWDDINWDGQSHLVRKGLLQKSDMVFSPSPKTREWCLGRRPYEEGPECFIAEFKTLKPCIHGSDAHKLVEIGNPCRLRGSKGHSCDGDRGQCDLRYTWIKADPTFEGLKQLLYEPSDRVFIQPTDPTPLKSNYCITGLEIARARVNDDLSLAQSVLEFNTGLVAVTGGKGAGKTALVDLIANCFVDRCNTDDSNSFVRRIVVDRASVATKLVFKDGSEFQKMLTDARFIEQSEIVYIAQGELERYIGEKSDLDRYIRDLIFESPQVKNTVKAFEFEELAKRTQEEELRLSQAHQSIERLELGTSEGVLAAARREKSQIEGELKDVDEKIPALEARLNKEKVGLIQQKQANRSMLQVRKSRLLQLGEDLAIARQFLSEDLPRFNACVSRINAALRELAIEGKVEGLAYPSEQALLEVERGVEGELRRVVGTIEQSEKELRGYESEMQEHAKCLGRRTELNAKLESANQKLRAIASEAERLEKVREERNGLFRALLGTILQRQQKYAELIQLFGSQKAGVLSDLDFKATLQFDRNALLSGLEDVLDNRQVDVRGMRGASEFEELQTLYDALASGNAAAIDGLATETARLCKQMKARIKTSRAISVGNLYKCLYETHISVVPVVTYKKTALNRLSLGQKATVLIKIYLAQGTHSIVIDSHDDHLDNEFIMEELVGAIRQAKTYRQVILASNNGNVVINSDAEQIVIANRETGLISYQSGSIENPSIRDRALKVLEGGEAAFKKRQEKYRIGT
jgi:hypothetical protein